MQKNKKLKIINASIYKSLLDNRGDNNEALDFLCHLIEGKKSIFLTGKAGTGKSTLIRDIIKCIRSNNKNPIILGSTGIAAVNIGGKTVHSYFNLKTSNIFYPDIIKHQNNFQLDDEHINEINSAPFIIIDEISMLSANIVDNINAILSINVGNGNGLAFGGKQIIFTGDVLQLAPVEDWEWKKFYEGKYNNAWFFNSHTFENRSGYKFEYSIVKLEKNYRQDGDDGYLKILDNIRNCNVTDKDIKILNNHVDDGQEIDERCIILGTHNDDVDFYNDSKFNQLPGKKYYFYASQWGKAPETRAKNIIELKVGARIMMLNNDRDMRRINGSMGYVRGIYSEKKEIIVELDDGGTYVVGMNTWKNTVYKRKAKGELEEITIGEYTQIPVQLAYAITVHKSQGLTFEYAYLDIEKTFAGGQAYTALSRIKSLNGLILSTEINKNILFFNPDALRYYLYTINEKKINDEIITDGEAEELSNYTGFTINFNGAESITNKQTEVISKFKGSFIILSGITKLDDNSFENLCNFKGLIIDLTGLNNISYGMIETLKRQGINVISDLEYKALGAKEDKLNIVLKKNLIRNEKIHIITGNKHDQDGYYYDLWNDKGKYKLTNSKYDSDGYDWNGWDRYGFQKNGIHKETNEKWNPRGFDKNFIHQNGTKYDNNGYDFFLYNEYGFDPSGIHRDTNKPRDKHGFNAKGINKYTNDEVDKYGYSQYRYHSRENGKDEPNTRDNNQTNNQLASQDKHENKGNEIPSNKGKLYHKKLYHNNGNLQYDGDIRNNLYNGKGKLFYENGNIQFEGTFLEGKYQEGTEYFRFKNGKIKYEGNFENGLYNGEGKQYFNDGSIYEGLFKKGKFEGKGKFTYFDGEIYEGEFKNGLYDENLKRLI